MRTKLALGWLVLLAGLCAPIRAQEIKDAESFEPAYFMAGMRTGSGAPTRLPQCYIGFRSSGHQRQAEMFLFLARIWLKKTDPSEPLTYYQTPHGEQFIIENWPLATALRNFFMAPRFDPAAAPTFNVREVVIAEPAERLSFLAGFYAAYHSKKEDVFFAPAGYAIRDVLYLFLLEGCEVSEVKYHNVVPDSIDFKGKPSKEVARVFALVDGWQPEAVEWKP